MIPAYIRSLVVLFLPLIALASGCGPSSPAVSDIETATRLLDSTFQLWKSGQTVANLREGSPPVYVAEELWEQGFLLSGFAIDGVGEHYGSNVRFLVTLNGKDKGGAGVSRQVKYLVTTTPALTIARADR